MLLSATMLHEDCKIRLSKVGPCVDVHGACTAPLTAMLVGAVPLTTAGSGQPDSHAIARPGGAPKNLYQPTARRKQKKEREKSKKNQKKKTTDLFNIQTNTTTNHGPLIKSNSPNVISNESNTVPCPEQ